ncbi:MAG: methyl-accepting chemotaxis protein [Myxococcaceae bacterium]
MTSKQTRSPVSPTLFVLPSMASSGLVAFLALYYGLLTLSLPPQAVPAFVGLALLTNVLLTTIAHFRGLRRLPTLSKLGGARPSKELLQQAVREVARLPDHIVRVNMEHWLFGPFAIALVLRYLEPSVSWTTVIRLSILGVLFGPLTSVLAYSLVVPRTRRAISQIAGLGLCPAEVAQAIPPGRRQTALRLLMLVLALTVIPATLVADATLSFLRQAVSEVSSLANPEERRLRAESAEREATRSAAVLVVLSLALAGYTVIVAARGLARPMGELAQAATDIASGKLATPRLIPAEDETWAASAAFSAMHGQLSEVMTQLGRASMQIASSSAQSVAACAIQETSAATQAQLVERTTVATATLTRSANQISQEAEAVAAAAAQTLASAREGRASAEAFGGSLAKVRGEIQALGESVRKQDQLIGQVEQLAKVIGGVAERSDLLALNAELEGTKAGEFGKSFSLVAREMRRLAENVAGYAKEIGPVLEKVRDATEEVMRASNGGAQATEAGVALATRVSSSLAHIVELAGRTDGVVQAISRTVQEHNHGTSELASSMQEISRLSAGSTGGTKQISEATRDLSRLADELRAAVERFEVAAAG